MLWSITLILILSFITLTVNLDDLFFNFLQTILINTYKKFYCSTYIINPVIRGAFFKNYPVYIVHKCFCSELYNF